MTVSAWPYRAVRSFLLLLPGLLFATLAHALDPAFVLAQYQHTSWTAREGAPSLVAALAQTPDGVLWLGGADGLYRFDGFEFEHLSSLGGKPIGREPVLSLLAEADGGLWIGSAGAGLAHFAGARLDRFVTGTGPQFADSIAKAPDGAIWFLQAGKPARLDGGRIALIGNDLGYPGTPAWSLAVDPRGTLWIMTPGAQHVYFLPKGAGRFEPAPEDFIAERVAFTRDGVAWGCSVDGLRAFDPAAAVRTARLALKVPCGTVVADRDDGLWLQAAAGLLHFGRSRSLLDAEVPASDGMTRTQGLTANEIRGIFQDHDGNMWVGTARGLDRFRESLFATIALEGREEAPAIEPDRTGGLWVAKPSSPLLSMRGDAVSRYPDAPHSLYLRAIATAQDGTAYFASGAVVRTSDGGRHFEELPGLGMETRGPFVRSMAVDASGTLWITGGEQGAVARYVDGRWVKAAGADGFPDSWTARVVHADKKGRVWFGSGSDAVLFEKAHARLLPHASTGLDVGGITSFFEGRERLWVGGVDGLAYFDGERFHGLRPLEGDNFSQVGGIVETPQGDLWLHGLDAAWRISAADLSSALASGDGRVNVTRLDASDGLDGISGLGASKPNLVQATDGRLWFSTTTGLAWIDPAKLEVAGRSPRVFVRSVTVDDKPFDVAATNVFPSRNERVQFAYTAVSPGMADRIRFRYRLEGVDAGWHDVGRQRSATFNNLPPGDYRFVVDSTDDRGHWGADREGAVFRFSVAPAWFQTWEFRVALAFALVAAAIVAYRWRTQRLTMLARAELRAQQRERDRMARDLHDTLLQSMQALVWRLRLLSDRAGSPPATQSALEEALGQADRALEEGRGHILGLGGVADSRSLLELAQDIVKGESNSRQADVAMSVIGEERALKPLVHAAASRILGEALHNALRHSGGRVTLSLAYLPKSFKAIVSDDGGGIPQHVLAHGRPGHIGLRTMRERAAAIHAKLTVGSPGGVGTTIELRVPARQAYPAEGRGWRGWWRRGRA